MSIPPPLDDHERIARSPSVVATVADDEAILMCLERGRCYGVNPTGARIWARLEQPIRVLDLVRQMVDDAGSDVTDAERQTREFLTNLKSAGLIRLAALPDLG